MKETKKLENRIEELEDLLTQKDGEIKTFKKELIILNDQIEDLILKLNTQLKVAHKIQQKLVPTEFPNIPGFEFSTKFQASIKAGGDYFDIFEIEDRFRFSLLLSSCTGYSISSLFLSILLRLTSHIETKKGAQPDKVLSLIAKELTSQMSEQDSANIFYALINRRNFEMVYCHQGDNLAFLYRAHEKDVIEVKPTGDALSTKLKAKMTAGTISLNPKDCLVVLSDGVLQVKNAKGAVFEKSKLKKIILDYSKKNPHELRNEIVFELQKWNATKELNKDITVLVAEVKDKILKLAR